MKAKQTPKQRALYAAARARQEKAQPTLAKIGRILAFLMIGASVIGGYLLTPLPVALGLTVLAGIRLWVWQREEKREQARLLSE